MILKPLILALVLPSLTIHASETLNKPAAYQPTVGSEIARGKSAALRCVDRFDWLSYSVCIDQLNSREPAPSDAFKLGLNWATTKGLDLRRRTAQAPWPTQNPELFAESSTAYRTVWRSLQAKIGLSFEEVESAR